MHKLLCYIMLELVCINDRHCELKHHSKSDSHMSQLVATPQKLFFQLFVEKCIKIAMKHSAKELTKWFLRPLPRIHMNTSEYLKYSIVFWLRALSPVRFLPFYCYIVSVIQLKT